MSKYYRENGEEIKFNKDSFELVQNDQKIYDTKFETKATTFIKDAFKRFCKNKSSVVAAILIGILLILSFFVPVLSTKNITQVDLDQSLLVPKLFDTGFGWWDGTKKYENILWNDSTNSPDGFKSEYVEKWLGERITKYVNVYNSNAKGGYLVIKNDITRNKNTTYSNLTPISLSSSDNVNLYVSFYTYQEAKEEISDYEFLNNYGVMGEYRIVVICDNETYVLRDWTKTDFSDYSVNLTEFLNNKSITNVESFQFCIELNKLESNSYILLKSAKFTTTNENPSSELVNKLNHISINDANTTAGLQKGIDGKFPLNYYQCVGGGIGVFHAETNLVSFIYDEYGAKLGNKDGVIDSLTIQSYIDNGWLSLSLGKDENQKFKVNDYQILDQEKCPINSISGIKDLGDGWYEIICNYSVYKYKGYDSMPKYLFGTTNDGKDLFKLAFNSLKTSLLLAIIVSAVCFAFGLVWGSISGYFGGTVDLVMERFCEILGGVPYIVVMTLAVLTFGNNIVTFGLAMCLTGWMGTSSITRTQFYRFKGREYILASRTLGANDTRLIFKHILPNSLGTIVTSSVLMIPSVIFSEATISYLGLGLKGVDSFGVLLSKNQQYIATYPMLIVIPSLIISILLISFNLFGNGLRDALNPSLKGSE